MEVVWSVTSHKVYVRLGLKIHHRGFGLYVSDQLPAALRQRGLAQRLGPLAAGTRSDTCLSKTEGMDLILSQDTCIYL